MPTSEKQSAWCRCCGRIVRTVSPRGGDGSAVVFAWHSTAAGAGDLCPGSRMEPERVRVKRNAEVSDARNTTT